MEDSRGQMESSPPPESTVPPRVRRILELVYGVDGVTGARVWQWDCGVAVGVRVAAQASAEETLHRVEAAVAGAKQPGESWEFGLIVDEAG